MRRNRTHAAPTVPAMSAAPALPIPPTPPLVRWGAVFCGAVVALALALLVGSLWVALAFGSHRSLFYDHLATWFAGTAAGAVFVAALIAGVSSGRRGPTAGVLTGLTTWAVVVLGGVAAGVPALAAYGSTRPITVNGIRIAVVTVRPWTTFWSLLIGLGAAVVGGFLGGIRRRAPRAVSQAPQPVVVEPAVRPPAETVEAPVAQPVG
jgi:hypothetical protein